ncbi:LacI family DNA-binding transcriptional regulator [Puniceicoccus vermicola]|uniref:LacI family DNA-binding transcriptional regulator n=1 Tax=Puniceicoccus vermicola TaxID=388746 RepID=A0A7X1B1F6_9BACT|nr:LacI family DNA-binding transcriptional regulator [Puniceicoccus vermicola]MBC2603854.1 LacI family DNA-binding transcriptional regulator [Puniceicoccus vermicola]
MKPSEDRFEASAPSMADVARAAGVSRATVSRVLNGSAAVKDRTIERVESAMEALGYKRNPMVQALMNQVRRRRVQSICNLLWLEEVGEEHTANRLYLIREAARRRAESLGYGFDVLHQRVGELSEERLSGILLARGIRGVVIAPAVRPVESYSFPWGDVATATIGRSLTNPRISYVMMHFQHAMDLMLEELNARGYRRIGFMLSREGNARTERVPLMAYLHHRFFSDPGDWVELLWDDGLSGDSFQEWYDMNRPDVVVGLYTNGLDSLRSCGFRLPDDVGFASLSSRDETPEVSGVRAPVEALGAGAVDLVVAQIQRNECGIPTMPKTILVEGDWREGSTLRRKKSSSES